MTQATHIEAVLSDFTDELTAQQRRYIIDQICRITAAAQVREPETKYVWARPSDKEREWQDATIERCAQIADKYKSDPVCENIAAAIRKLKDAP